MKHLPRRLAVLGGAAAIAAGGFAFLAENNVTASSLGEGQSTVTGYTVSAITYHDTPGPPSTSREFLYQVTFTLTSKSTATANPTQVIVAAINGAGKSTTGLTGSRRPLSMGYDWGTTYTESHTGATAPRNRGCKEVSWTAGTNSGTFTCQWTYPYYTPSDAPFAKTVVGLDVTASN